jgi:hypothetical protein
MWFDSLSDDWPKLLREKLVDDKSFITLSNIASALYQHEIHESSGVAGARERTLTYLKDLLENEYIKIGKYEGWDGVADEYTGTPSEIIERIRTEWDNTHEDDTNSIHPIVYEMSIHIVLKENPWPVWR